MRVGTLRLGEDRKHFVGELTQTIERGSNLIIQRRPGTELYDIEAIDVRTISTDRATLLAFIDSDLLGPITEPIQPKKQSKKSKTQSRKESR